MLVDQLPTAEPPRKPPASDDAAAYVLSRALGSEALPPSEALAALKARVETLKDPTAPAALAELSRQLPVLEALFQRFAAEALRARRPADRSMLLRAALQAQQAHARTFALLRGMALAAKGQAVVELEEGDSPDADADSDEGRW